MRQNLLTLITDVMFFRCFINNFFSVNYRLDIKIVRSDTVGV